MEYSLRDIISVFIWELPMKKEDIDIANDLMIIRDNTTTKKIKVSLLLEYFSQNYKAEQLEQTIENSLRRISDEYIPKYEYILKELQICDNLINGSNGLKERFNDNRNRINALVLSLAQCGVTINNLEDAIYRLVNSIKELEDKFSISTYSTQRLIEKQESLSSEISDLGTKTDRFVQETDSLESNCNKLNADLDQIFKDSNNDIETKVDLIIQKMNHEYDVILSAIDRYHHTHE